jgi:ubiquinone/menaquinone biosynthesis C-methylase UbiE
MNPALQAAYRERSKVYDALSVASPWHRLYREHTEIAIERALGVLSSGPLHILDAGGGTGLTAQWLAGKGHRVTLVDSVAGMLEFAREKAREHAFEVREGDLADLEFLPAGAFDAVICTQVLNFCPDLTAVFGGFYRVLKSPGIVFADIDNAIRWCVIEALDGHIDNAIAIAESGRDRDRNIVGADYFFHYKLQLFDIAERAGLPVQSSWGLEFVAPYLHLFAQSQEFLDKQNLPRQARFYAEEENYARLKRLESVLAGQNLPDEMAGYLQFVCSKR